MVEKNKACLAIADSHRKRLLESYLMTQVPSGERNKEEKKLKSE